MRDFYILPAVDKPRERMAEVGVKALSDLELMSVVLGRGIKGKKVSELAKEVMQAFDSMGVEAGFQALANIKGIGAVRAGQLLAGFELFRRLMKPLGIRIKSPQDALPFLLHYADRKQEHLLVISLSGANEVIKTRCVSIGLVDSALVHPREVFADVIVDRASAIILAHNHPSGDTTPSDNDFNATKKIKSAGDVLKIKLLDHIIFSQRGYYSFLENGVL